MAVKKHGVHFDITAENATDRAFRAVESNLNAVGRAAAVMGRALSGGLVASAAIEMGKAFANAAIESEQASKRLDAVLKATGNSAGRTKQQLDQMADAMAESTQFDDESLRNAQAQMLKFGNIHGETFDKAMKLSADLAAFMDTDLNSAVQMVGKALTSPTEGMNSLERAVGKFNPAARDMIKNLAESGNEAKAQAVVLDLLKGKVGGAAEALNSGLTKATRGATKAWDEMLEAFGRTKTFQGAATTSLGMIEQGFKDIKAVIESGTWYEKFLLLMSYGPGGIQARMAGWRPDIPLTPGAAEPSQTASGKIRGLPSATVMDDELVGAPMSERDVKAWKYMLEAQEKAKQDRKRLGEEQLREAERMAQAQVNVDEWAAEDTRQAWGYFFDWEKKKQAERERDAQRATDSWVQSAEIAVQAAESVVYTWDEAGNRIEIARDAWDEMAQQAKKTDDFARDLGLTFTSAFEDAVVGGKKFGDVLKGLQQDLLRLMLRKTITEPLTDWAGTVFKGGGGGFGGVFDGVLSAAKGLFGGGVNTSNYFDFATGGIMTSAGPVPLRAYASGGIANSPQAAIFGEGSTPEAFVPLPDGKRIPVAMKGGGGGMVVNINAPGADAAQLRRVVEAVGQLHASFDRRAVGAMQRAYNMRGVSTALG